MKKYFAAFVVFVFLFSCTQGTGEPPPGSENSEHYSSGRQFLDWFHSYKLESFHARIIDRNYKMSNLRDFRRNIELQLGSQKQVLNEIVGRHRDFRNSKWFYYICYSRFSKTKRIVKTQFIYNTRGQIYQFSIEGMPEAAATKFKNYRTKTKLRLPFNGEWYVSAGGREINYNHHVVSPDQRFAYDFVIRREGATFKNDGTGNEDYYCFATEIFAPGSGVIKTVVNDVADNSPGDVPKNTGNYIVLDHGNGEFSILAHFKHKSIVVKEGDSVTIGRFLGLCGNSGHSSEPHLHYHLQNGPDMLKGEGLPAQFQHYSANGKNILCGEPSWNEYIITE